MCFVSAATVRRLCGPHLPTVDQNCGAEDEGGNAAGEECEDEGGNTAGEEREGC